MIPAKRLSVVSYIRWMIFSVEYTLEPVEERFSVSKDFQSLIMWLSIIRMYGDTGTYLLSGYTVEIYKGLLKRRVLSNLMTQPISYE